MTDNSSKPNGRRWPWLVGVVLLVASVAGWPYWPRADARFVGKWANGSETIEMDRTGGYRSFNPTNGLAHTGHFRVEGDALIIVTKVAESGLRPAVNEIINTVSRSNQPPEMHWKFRIPSPDVLELHTPRLIGGNLVGADGATIRLERIPD